MRGFEPSVLLGMPNVTPYRLSIAPALEQFRCEIEYACDFLDSCHFVARVAEAERVLHYGDAAPANAVSVPAALFPDAVRVAQDGLHPERDRLDALCRDAEPIPLFKRESNSSADGRLGYDALGVIFLLLSRLEERGSVALDRYGRFCHAAAIATRLGRHADPLADQSALDLVRALTGEARPANRTDFRVLLTHDVDRLCGYHRWWEPLRNAAGDILKRHQPGAAFTLLTQAYFGGLPWRSLRALLDLSENAGLQSRFYFMGPSRRQMDSPYAATMPALLRRVAAHVIERGHVVGFHPGFGTQADSEIWCRQKVGLEEVIGHSVDEGRQHVLGYVAEATPDIWANAGMRLDCTLAFPEASGYRSGTCRPYAAYSLVRRRALRLQQIATAITDFGLFDARYRNLSVDEAIADVAPTVAVCRRFGGSLALLYHLGQTDVRIHRFFDTLLGEVI